MQIAIDALGLPPFGGARVSTVSWLAALATHSTENRYVVFLSHPEESLRPFPHVEQRIVGLRNRFAVRVWAEVALPRMLARERVGLLHSMKNLGVFSAQCPTVITVNDLTHVVLRHLYPRVDSLYWQYFQPRVLRRAAKIIAISHSTKRDLLRFYRLRECNIAVIYPSCDEVFRRPCADADIERVRGRYHLPQRILLYVGGLGIHKNVITLVRAFEAAAREISHGLVIVGGTHHTSSDRAVAAYVSAAGLDKRVWLLGSVPREDLPPLYRMADLFISVSLNEGFGLALLEAMASGTPVLAGRTSSIPEVVGEAGCLVDDPTDADALCSEILRLTADHDRLRSMSTQGLRRSQLFSWKVAADRTLALYREVAGG